MNAPAASTTRSPAREFTAPVPVSGARVRWRRLTHWEYWPAWVIYAPLVPWIVYQALRQGGLGVACCVNPCIPLGGLVGESKLDILRRLPARWTLGAKPIAPGAPADRVADLRRVLRERGWSFPVVLKPDVGERGTGVRIVHDEPESLVYFREHAGATIVQQYHPGPHEAGIFYVREPGQPSGRIFSITDKRFASVTGDGRSTIGALISADARHSAQASALHAQLGDRLGEVPGLGERVSVGQIGNHCRGTMFLDGRRLITPELTRALDAIADATPGFCFGRLDVRYECEERLCAGEGFMIVELNGLLSESTNIYDPSWGFWRAQRVLRAQWRLAYAIGRENQRRGARAPGIGEILRAVRGHLGGRSAQPPRAMDSSSSQRA